MLKVAHRVESEDGKVDLRVSDVPPMGPADPAFGSKVVSLGSNAERGSPGFVAKPYFEMMLNPAAAVTLARELVRLPGEVVTGKEAEWTLGDAAVGLRRFAGLVRAGTPDREHVRAVAMDLDRTADMWERLHVQQVERAASSPSRWQAVVDLVMEPHDGQPKPGDAGFAWFEELERSVEQALKGVDG